MCEIKKVKVYVASSWRNPEQQRVVETLRGWGFEVYDFRSSQSAFNWAAIDPNWRDWPIKEFIKALNHPVSKKGFVSDMTALRDSDIVILVLPCGKSAHLEAGFAAGTGKPLLILSPLRCEPELAYKIGVVSENLRDIFLLLPNHCALSREESDADG